MKILIVGTGADIPPTGWGAVEAIIWEHLQRIPKLGVEVDLINTHDYFSIPWIAAESARQRNIHYDFVHFHYDIQFPYARTMAYNFPTAMTSHFPFLGTESMYPNYGWWKVYDYFLDEKNDNFNFCISKRDIEYFKNKGVKENKLFRLKLGAPEDILFDRNPKLADKSIYLGKICARKRQFVYGDLDCLHFAGNVGAEDPNARTDILKNYLGEWTKTQVHTELTNYGNLVLLSDGENTPLVVREALIAGLGVVLSESSIEELDVKPYITIVPNSKRDDLNYVHDAIEENREISLKMRDEIRDYGISNFGWDACIKDYIQEIERAIS